MTTVFELWNVYGDDEKYIGTYSTKENADLAIHRLKSRPEFSEHPERFEIYDVVIDRGGWTEGFVSVTDSDFE